MISRLRGILIEKTLPKIVIEVAGGVGYEAEVPLTTFDKLPELMKDVTLHTHLIVRDDGQQLYGFYQIRDRQLFRILIKVNGVGPKLALAILSTIDPAILVDRILHKDAAALERVPGVGKRTAQRLLIELHDRLADWRAEGGLGNTINDTKTLAEKSQAKIAMEEATSALISLGYKPQLASRAISKIYVEEATSEHLIREALKTLSVA
jgi:holliday junction DNA helicase RuvA